MGGGGVSVGGSFGVRSEVRLGGRMGGEWEGGGGEGGGKGGGGAVGLLDVDETWSDSTIRSLLWPQTTES